MLFPLRVKSFLNARRQESESRRKDQKHSFQSSGYRLLAPRFLYLVPCALSLRAIYFVPYPLASYLSFNPLIPQSHIPHLTSQIRNSKFEIRN